MGSTFDGTETDPVKSGHGDAVVVLVAAACGVEDGLPLALRHILAPVQVVVAVGVGGVANEQ